MKFEKIIEFSLKEYNENKSLEDRLPQDGVIISVYFNNKISSTYVAVGFSK